MSFEGSRAPLVMAWVANLMFAPRIESAARGVGFRVRLVECAADLIPAGSPRPRSLFMECVTRWGPALLIVDLENAQIPWETWLTWLRLEPSTRRIPVIAFGSHKDTALLARARAAGADAVLARSRFFSALPELIVRHARVVDAAALSAACAQPLHPLAREGVERFNAGEFFEAHELLETAWMQDQTTGRDLYRAMLQVAVAYYQVQRENYAGAVKMFLRLRQWINAFPDRCRGVDVARLRQDAFAIYDRVLDLGPEGMKAASWDFAPIHLVE